MFAIAGCKESDDMPTPPEQNLTMIDLPTDTSTYEQSMKYIVNLPPRANSKVRKICTEALTRHKAELEKAKDADAAKKIALIDASQARIDTLATFLRVQEEYGSYVRSFTSPIKDQKQAIQELLDKKDPQYPKLKKAYEDAKSVHEAAKQKALDLGKEFIVAQQQ